MIIIEYPDFPDRDFSDILHFYEKLRRLTQEYNVVIWMAKAPVNDYDHS